MNLTVRPKALDLFCGAGGAAMGLHRAGFDVTGIDINPQPHYPFTFIQGDALEASLDGYDFIWASPPCQAWSAMQRTNKMRKNHPKLIDATRSKLEANGDPWIIENVPGAPLRNPAMLCGLSFGLRVLRHRYFESSMFLIELPHITHTKQKKVRGRTSREYLSTLSHIGFTTGSNMEAFRDAMGCDWMTPNEARQAIPPAYSEFLGRQALKIIQSHG